MFPGYTVGADAYDDIAGVCEQYGRKAVIIGGEKALAAAKDKILKAIEGSKIEITGVYWYGGEASLEDVEMLRPKAAAKPSTPARCSLTTRSDPSSPSRR